MAPFLRRTGLELNFCCSPFFSAPNRSLHSIDFPPGSRAICISSNLSSYWIAKVVVFAKRFLKASTLHLLFWADDMPQWIDLPKDWGCETFLPFADKMLLTHHMCLMNIQHGRMSRFFSSPDKQESTTSYLTLTGSDHSLGCSWNKLTACQLVVWFFYRRHAAVSHLGCFIGGLWTRTPISSHVKQLDWDELGKIDSISQASPMMVETISIFKDFKDLLPVHQQEPSQFLKDEC